MLAPVTHAAEFHVATDGKDGNPGTPAEPFATVQRAEKAASPGDTVFIHGGTYRMSQAQIARTRRDRCQMTLLTKSGRAGQADPLFRLPGRAAGIRSFRRETAGLPDDRVSCGWLVAASQRDSR